MAAPTGTQQNDRLLDGRYQLVRELGAGGMGRVYLAEDEVLHRRVAVKLLQPHYAADPRFVERLRREARAAAALTHPHVVAVHDLGESDGAPYIVMQYVEGETLKERIARLGALPLNDACRIADQVLQAVEHAHRHGVIHRDLTARNILLDERDSALVTDFGIARLGSSPFTSAPVMLGTAHYAAPEQVRGQGADARSDVYTVGVVLYEMLTGELPFTGEDVMAVALRHVNDPPPPPTRKRPDLTPAMEAVVLRALEKDPDRRFQSATELRDAIRAAVDGDAAVAIVNTAGKPEAGGGAIATAAAGAVISGSAAADASEPPVAGRDGAVIAADAVPAFGEPDAEPACASSDATAVDAPTPPAPAGAVAPPTPGVQTPGSGQPPSPNPALTMVAPVDPQTRMLVQEPATRAVYGETGPAAARHSRRRRLVIIAAAFVLLCAAAGAAYWFLGRTVTVPDAVAKARPQAVSLLLRSGLDAVVRYEYVDGVRAGTVARQSPKAGARIRRGEPVQVWVSSGPLHVRLPDLHGLTAAQAAGAVRSRGLKAAGSRGRTADVTVGHVYRQDPSAGTSLERGATARYWVSSGLPRALVPDVKGWYYEDAAATLEDQGFEVDVHSSVGWGDTPLTVVGQDPEAGTRLEKGSVVVIDVAIL